VLVSAAGISETARHCEILISAVKGDSEIDREVRDGLYRRKSDAQKEVESGSRGGWRGYTYVFPTRLVAPRYRLTMITAVPESNGRCHFLFYFWPLIVFLVGVFLRPEIDEIGLDEALSA